MFKIFNMSHFDHIQIRDQLDRDQTAALLAALADPTTCAADADEIACSLDMLADPRGTGASLSILRDRALPSERRDLAGAYLSEHGLIGPEMAATLLEGDAVEGRWALLAMHHDSALIRPVAADPTHPLQRWAIRSLSAGFDLPEFQTIKISALSHPDPQVRAAAADSLFMDAPAAAEQPLIAALSDDVPDVARAAADTLRYFPTRPVYLALASATERPDEGGRAAAESLAELLMQLEDALELCDTLRTWARPILHLLDLQLRTRAPMEEGGSWGAAPDRSERPARRPPSLFELLAEPGGCWAQRLDALLTVPPLRTLPKRRAAWRELLTQHPDHAVRERGCRLLAAWGDTDALLGLLGDPHFVVMKAAMYHLGTLPPDPTIGERARAHLNDARATGTHGRETLVTWAHHVPGREALPTLRELAATDLRDGVRAGAIDLLAARRDREGVLALLPALRDPPFLSWGCPYSLISAARALGVGEREVHALRDTDHLEIAELILDPKG